VRQSKNFLMLVIIAGLVIHATASAVGVEKPSSGAWPDRTFRWYYNPQHAPSWLSLESARLMVQNSAKVWEICGVKMIYLGDSDARPGNMDNINVVGWSLQMPKQLRGLTIGKAQDGRLLERDVMIRPDRKEFNDSPRLLQKVIMHEFGHAIGITHSPRCDDVMTLAADCPQLSPDLLPLKPTNNDLDRCQEIYPLL